jgi:hypothetical protein
LLGQNKLFGTAIKVSAVQSYSYEVKLHHPEGWDGGGGCLMTFCLNILVLTGLE